MKRTTMPHHASLGSRVRTCLPFAAVLLGSLVGTSAAHGHHPNKECQPVWPRIDCIPPLGNNLPIGYRRKYNRPSYIEGKIAYWIAPSSQEAMAWHRAVHAGAYQKPKKHLRLEQHYFYPKPWQALTVGPRRPVNDPDNVYGTIDINQTEMMDAPEVDVEESDDTIAPEVLEETLDVPEEIPADAIESQLDLPPADAPGAEAAEGSPVLQGPDTDSGALLGPARSGVRTASRNASAAGVSRRSVSRPTGTTSKPSSFRQLLGL
ncbi:hypothetical protein FYK55_10400 [Roseiconus nitratireducens]|uniref:Uncharacterized protein n=1 Tax=Roseiconus nitratireducens TaxID=2605748 RepID=A0A5M6D8E1_9BACT|nr:hypothetical protein [Roseiconus nitratireducens]KAA5543613.1 hypothetical protein FYK55_10400 [Roseiconus nitratireducens]